MDRVVYAEDGAGVARTSEPLTLSLLATGFLLGGGATAGAIAANALLDPEHKKRIDEFWNEDHWKKLKKGWDDVAGRFTGSRDARSPDTVARYAQPPEPAANSAAASSATNTHAGKRGNHNMIHMALMSPSSHALSKQVALHPPVMRKKDDQRGGGH
jgi:hypothetical protein